MAKMRIVVEAGNHNRKNCPVSVELNIPKGHEEDEVVLTEVASKREILCQREAKDGKKLSRVWWIIDDLEANCTQLYEVNFLPKESYASKIQQSASGVKLAKTEDKIQIQVNGSLFTVYNFGQNWVRPFYHPVIGPGGVRVTRNFPMEDVEGEKHDHHHHKSIWVAYGEVNGVDNWSEEKGHGGTIHKSFSTLVDGPVYAWLESESDWVSNEGKKVLEESRKVGIYALPDDARIMDLLLTLRATEGDVTFGDTKEAGFCSVRVATVMDVDQNKGGKIENSWGGVNEAETWGKRAEWCDYSGYIGGTRVGIVVFDHPMSFRHPTYWHVRNYGLMTTNVFGVAAFTGDPSKNGSYTVKKGDSLTFAYRIYIHRGDATGGDVKNRYLDYVVPPKITVE